MRISDGSSDVCSSDLEGVDVALLQADFGAKLLEAVQVEVDRARADGAAARQRHLGLADARHQRPQHQHRGAHLAHQVVRRDDGLDGRGARSEEHTSELQSLMRISYAVFCLKTKTKNTIRTTQLKPTHSNTRQYHYQP